MKQINVVTLRSCLAEVLNQVHYKDEIYHIMRRGQIIATIQNYSPHNTKEDVKLPGWDQVEEMLCDLTIRKD